MSAKVDSSLVKGFVRIAKLNEARPSVRYDLDVDEIVWGDYALANYKSYKNELVPLLGFIRAVDLKGRIDVGTVMLSDLSVSSLHVPSEIKNGVVTLNPITMSIDQAKIRAAMDIRALAIPVARASIKINNLNAADSINPLLRKIMGEKPLLMEGMVTASIYLKSTGKSIHDHRSSLNGTLDVNMNNLVLEGVDLKHYSRKVVVDYTNRNGFRTRESYAPEFDPNSKNDFTSLTAKYNLSGSTFSTTDILLVSDTVNITGAGSIDFQKNTVKYRLVMDSHVPDRIDIRNKVLDHPMEYDVQGTFKNLTTQFDIERYDLRLGRLLIIEAKARKIKAIKNQGNSTWGR